MKCEIDRSQVLNVVLSYQGERDRVLRHLPVWKHFSDTTIFVSPENAPLGIPGYKEVLVGKSSHHGPANNQRMTEAFRQASQWKGKWVFINEGDSMCVALAKRMLPPPGGVSACRRKNRKPDKYKSPWFLWFPQLWTVEGAKKAYEVARKTDPASERGLADRFCGYIAWKSGIPVRNMTTSGDFAGAHTFVDFELFRGLMRLGVTWVHGIKDGPFFEELMKHHLDDSNRKVMVYTSELI